MAREKGVERPPLIPTAWRMSIIGKSTNDLNRQDAKGAKFLGRDGSPSRPYVSPLNSRGAKIHESEGCGELESDVLFFTAEAQRTLSSQSWIWLRRKPLFVSNPSMRPTLIRIAQ